MKLGIIKSVDNVSWLFWQMWKLSVHPSAQHCFESLCQRAYAWNISFRICYIGQLTWLTLVMYQILFTTRSPPMQHCILSETTSTCFFSFEFLSWWVFCCCCDGNLSYCLWLRSVPFFLRPHADVPSVLKCSCHNPYMRLGETLAADIILSVTDKHGNKTGKVSVWNLKLFFDFFPYVLLYGKVKTFWF